MDIGLGLVGAVPGWLLDIGSRLTTEPAYSCGGNGTTSVILHLWDKGGCPSPLPQGRATSSPDSAS